MKLYYILIYPAHSATSGPRHPHLSPAIGQPTPSKANMIQIQSLGENTVTIKDNQLIVQGPDHAQATTIAKQLSSGQAIIFKTF